MQYDQIGKMVDVGVVAEYKNKSFGMFSKQTSGSLVTSVIGLKESSDCDLQVYMITLSYDCQLGKQCQGRQVVHLRAST